MRILFGGDETSLATVPVRRVFGAALFVLVAAVVQGRVAFAETSPVAPVVHCGWALADSSPLAGPAEPFMYGPDDEAGNPLSAAQGPCQLDAAGVAHQPEGAQGLLHVRRDVTGPRKIQFWAVVSHPTSDAFGSDAGSVSWNVKVPSGATSEPIVPSGRSCAGANAPGEMWNAAITGADGTGAIAKSSVENQSDTGIWQACRQGRVRIFVGQFTLPTSPECGTYTVTTTGVVGAASASLSYGFDVLCTARATVDATHIEWDVSPGGSGVVSGDLDPTTTGQPTVTNNSSGPMQIGVVLAPLRQTDGIGVIENFGARLTHKDGATTAQSEILGGADSWFLDGGSVLCPGESAQLDLFVYAPAETPAGSYSGSFNVLAKAGGRC